MPLLDYRLDDLSWTEIWEKIKAGKSLERGTHKTLYNRFGTCIGEMRIVDFNYDMCEKGGCAKTTWVASKSSISYYINPAAQAHHFGTNSGGWENCEARRFLNDYLFDQLPINLQNIIKPVEKWTDGTKTSRSMKTIDRLWIPSCGECEKGWMRLSYNGLKDPFDRVIRDPISDRPKVAWLRNAVSGSNTNFWAIIENGRLFNECAAHEELVLPISFCI